MERFCELGFPTTNMEDWRETDVSRLAKSEYALAPTLYPKLTKKDLQYFLIDPQHVSTIVIVDGNYSTELSFIQKAAAQASVINLFSEASIQERKMIDSLLGNLATFYDETFVALNTAFMSDGVLIHVPKGEVIPRPIHILYLTTTHEKEVMYNYRNIIFLEEGSEATIIEHYASWDGSPSLTNVVTEIKIDHNAVLHHVKIQEEATIVDHLAVTQAEVHTNAVLTSAIFTVGARLSRNDLRVRLVGEGAECNLSGLVLASGEQHQDNHTLIDHQAPHGSSREIFKGIHTDSSRGVFNGRIIVREEAQITNAEQSNKNLLLSEKALVNSNPQLEIYADNVRCTHGSTTGQLDEDAIFYLRSRGLDVLTAQSLLINGFANEIIDEVQIGAVNIYLYRILSNWLLTLMSHKS